MDIELNPIIPSLPKIEDKTKINVRYGLLPPFTYAHIYWDEKSNELIYEVEEPVMNDKEKEVLKKLEEGLREEINIDVLEEKNVSAILDYIETSIKRLISELNLGISEETYQKIVYYLFRNFIGLNEIEPLIKDYYIEDIECNGINTPIYIVHRVYRNMKTNIMYTDMEASASFVEKLAQKCGRYISYANPLLDGTLPDGSRVNATYTKDITSRGPTFTIRKFTKVPWTPTQLIAMHTICPEMFAYFWLITQYKSNILIAGGTGSGKTTLLNAIAFFIPPEARVVSIEDTRELNLPRENWIPSVARTAAGTKKIGEVDLFDLLKNSFRQNPEYVIVGEVRGKEAFVLFQGMASGHASISTIHADSVETIMRRLETPPIELSPTLIMVLDAIVIQSHTIVQKQATRRVRKIVEIINITPEGVAVTNTPFMWNAADDKFYFKKDSKVFEKISVKYGISKEDLWKEFEKRARLLQEMANRKVFSFEEFQKEIIEYYKNPQAVLKKYGIE
ncbi:MAG: type II/IV secretion system ATPase subunit [Candidatus Pacearchaeota archaeon]